MRAVPVRLLHALNKSPAFFIPPQRRGMSASLRYMQLGYSFSALLFVLKIHQEKSLSSLPQPLNHNTGNVEWQHQLNLSPLVAMVTKHDFPRRQTQRQLVQTNCNCPLKGYTMLDLCKIEPPPFQCSVINLSQNKA